MNKKTTVKMQKKDGPVLNVSEDCVEVFKKSGYTKFEEKAIVSIDEMKKDQLKAYAKDKGIDIGDAKTVDEIRAKIKEAEEAGV
ncbi:MAG: hypothetical protein IJ491_03610 [Clostridia bacterium]|nr:hypothetical protein [Clostridia bacterium]